MLSHFSHVWFCDPVDCSPPGSSVHGILQAAMLEWVAMPSSRGCSQPRDQTHVSCTAGRFFTTEPLKRKKVKSLSCVWLFATPWTVAYQVPPSMGFYRQEYWSGLPFPSPGNLPHSGIEPTSPALQADSLPLSHRGSPPLREPQNQRVQISRWQVSAEHRGKKREQTLKEEGKKGLWHVYTQNTWTVLGFIKDLPDQSELKWKILPVTFNF